MLIALFRRDAQAAVRSGGGWFHAVFFFVIFAGFTAFAVGPEAAPLRAAAPALIWLGGALALQLSAARIFAADFEDGFLRVIAAEIGALAPYIGAKYLFMLLLSAAPIVFLAPVFFIVCALPPNVAFIGAAVFACGAPALCLAALLSSALTAAMRASGVLSAALAAPLIVPILIFGVSATERSLLGEGVLTADLKLLIALTLF